MGGLRDRDGAAVLVRDRAHDGQPETGPALLPRGAVLAEGVEGVRSEPGGHPALVPDRDDDLVTAPARGQHDGARTVVQRVVDEVAERLVEPGGVAAQRDVTVTVIVDGDGPPLGPARTSKRAATR